MSNKVTELLKQMRDAIKSMSADEVRALYEAKKHVATVESVAPYAHIERMVTMNSHTFHFESESTQVAFSINHVAISNTTKSLTLSIAAESNDYGYALAA